jgi:hypothetical protein
VEAFPRLWFSRIGLAVASADTREGAEVAMAYLDEHSDAKDIAAPVRDVGCKCLLFGRIWPGPRISAMLWPSPSAVRSST